MKIKTFSSVLLLAAVLFFFYGNAAEAVMVTGTLDSSSLHWNRITDRAGFPDSANDALPYAVFEIKTPSPGNTLMARVYSSAPFDSFLALYSSFDPNNPAANIIAADDDGGGYPHAQLSVSGLMANTSYYLVITSYSDLASAVYPRYGSYQIALEGSFTTVDKAAQVITFTPPATVTYGDAPVTLTATGGASGNPVTFVVTSGPGSMNGNTLTLTGVGTIVITASQAGNSDYNAAADVQRSITVAEPPTLILSRRGTGTGTVADNAGEINCGTECSMRYVDGSIVTLTATPAKGSVFTGWTGGECAGTGTCTVTMGAVKKVNAFFALRYAGGSDHSVLTKENGTLWAWGFNDYGQLGNGTQTASTSPVRIGTDDNWGATSAKAYHTVALKTDGTLWTWGFNYYGQLGNGTTTDSTLPVQIGTEANWVSVASGSYHTVALKADGTLWAWGYNNYGQLGDGTTSNRTSPVQIGTDTDWTAVSGGGHHTTALKSDGTLWTWGGNYNGQLGDGTKTTRTSPVKIGSDRDWASVASGWYYTVALKTDGTLWAWGHNYYGQFGDGTTSNRTAPVQIGTDTDWTAVSGGGYHTTALKSDGTLWTWGGNNNGQLGDGTTTNRTSPVMMGSDRDWVSVLAAEYHTLAIKKDGTVWAWGNIGTTNDATLPVKFQFPANTLTVLKSGTGAGTVTSDIAGISCSGDCTEEYPPGATVTLTATAGAGSIFSGWLGDGCSGTGSCTATMDRARNITALFALQYAGGKQHSLFIKPDGTLWAWGRNSDGQLGDGTLAGKTSPVKIGTDNKWVALSGGDWHSVALKSDGTLWAWGYNSDGQLGEGTTTTRQSPWQIGTDNNWAAVAAGGYHTVALKTDGTLWTWGYNGYGQLGDGTTTGKSFPVPIGSDADWRAIAAGGSHTLALKANGTLWAWGDNSKGQLGDGTGTMRTIPALIGANADWTAVAAGELHTVALKADGTVWTWGFNYSGQLGDGTTTNRDSPVQIGTDINWKAIAAGAHHTAALKADGSLWTWGRNLYGQIGNGTSGTGTNKTNPTRVGTANDWAAMDAGDEYTAALKADGTLWTWGNNSYGQLGDGTQTSRSTPIQSIITLKYPLALFKSGTGMGAVTGGAINCGDSCSASYEPGSSVTLTATAETGSIFAGWTGGGCSGVGTCTVTLNAATQVAAVFSSRLAAGFYHTALIKDDGTVWTWGSNSAGQLGDGTNKPTSTPVQVSGLTDVAALSAGELHTIALKKDGTVWAWGHNWAGQLGDGSNDLKYEPVQVSGLTGIVAIASGNNHNLALKSDGTVWAWGLNQNGRLGIGGTSNQNMPARIYDLSGVVAIAAGEAHSLALKSDGTVRAWGFNNAGNVGDGTTTDRYYPVQVSGLTNVVKVAAGQAISYAVKTDGTVWSWGWNEFGRLGDGTWIWGSPSPVQLSGLTGIVAMAAKFGHSVALKADGTVWAWGWNYFGQLGNGVFNTPSNVPLQVSGLTGIKGVVAGYGHSAALGADGAVLTWGWDGFGQGGREKTVHRTTPVQISSLAGIIAIGAGDEHSLAAGSDTGVHSWGNNAFGQLGDGTFVGKFVPANTLNPAGSGSLTGISALSGGGLHSLSITNGGDVLGWGHTWEGQLAVAGGSPRNLPVQAGGISDVKAVSAGYRYSLALKNDGTLWAWGDNSGGQLGDGTRINRNTPVQVSGLTNTIALGTGWGRSFAVKNDGTIWGWGNNSAGLLGDGTSTDQLTPVPLSGLTGIKAVAAGWDRTIVLKNDGTVWAWGVEGRLGNGAWARSTTPVQVNGLTNVKAIASGRDHSLALKDDGTVWAWGNNEFGRLGDGTTEWRLSPVQVSDLTGVIAIAGGERHSLALKSDGTVWAWGSNNYGQLGEGTVLMSNTPAQTNITTATTPAAQTVDNGSLVWTTGGNAGWYGQNAVSSTGGSAAQSGNIGDSQATWLETTVNGPALVSFNWKVSSEKGSDFLRVSIDGEVQPGAISGEINWQQFMYAVPAGTHTMRWEYYKDNGGSEGLDVAWVDNVQVCAGGYTLSPTGVDVSFAGGTGSIAVTPVGTSCNWLAVGNNPFITVTSGSSGAGAGTVGYSVAASTEISGSMLIAGQTIPINRTAAGGPDTTFNPLKGYVTHQGAGAVQAAGRKVLVQPDGKIITVVKVQPAGAMTYDLHLVRYNSDGTLDTGFGTAGIASYSGPYGGRLTHPSRWTPVTAVLQPDGKIVVATTNKYDYEEAMALRSAASVNSYDVLVLRFNADGTRDCSFGDLELCEVMYHGGYGDDMSNAVSLQSDGKILVAAESSNGNNSDALVIRLNTNGSLDTTFGTAGTVRYNGMGNGYDYALKALPTADGKIIVAGATNNGSKDGLLLLKHNADGTLDTAFGNSGISTYFGAGDGYAYAAELQADGKILVAAELSNGANADFLVMRFNANGTVDTGFANTGLLVYNGPGDDYDDAEALAVQPDGKILAGGGMWDPAHGDAALIMRLNSDGTPDQTFGRNGIITRAGSWTIDLALQSDGKILAVGEEQDQSLLMRLLGHTNLAAIKGDINNDGEVDLKDAILVLQSLVRANPTGLRLDDRAPDADVDGDNRLGLPEVIFVLQKVAGTR